MHRKLITLAVTGIMVVGSSSVATAHHMDGHEENRFGLCTAEANGGNPGGNGRGNGNAPDPDCETEPDEPDTAAPTFADATYNDGVVTLTYSEPIECAEVDPSDYQGTLVRDGQELGTEQAATATCDGETSLTVQITADEGTTNALEPGDTLIIEPTGTNDVSDAAGNEQPTDDEISVTIS